MLVRLGFLIPLWLGMAMVGVAQTPTLSLDIGHTNSDGQFGYDTNVDLPEEHKIQLRATGTPGVWYYPVYSIKFVEPTTSGNARDLYDAIQTRFNNLDGGPWELTEDDDVYAPLGNFWTAYGLAIPNGTASSSERVTETWQPVTTSGEAHWAHDAGNWSVAGNGDPGVLSYWGRVLHSKPDQDAMTLNAYHFIETTFERNLGSQWKSFFTEIHPASGKVWFDAVLDLLEFSVQIQLVGMYCSDIVPTDDAEDMPGFECLNLGELPDLVLSNFATIHYIPIPPPLPPGDGISDFFGVIATQTDALGPWNVDTPITIPFYGNRFTACEVHYIDSAGEDYVIAVDIHRPGLRTGDLAMDTASGLIEITSITDGVNTLDPEGASWAFVNVVNDNPGTGSGGGGGSGGSGSNLMAMLPTSRMSVSAPTSKSTVSFDDATDLACPLPEPVREARRSSDRLARDRSDSHARPDSNPCMPSRPSVRWPRRVRFGISSTGFPAEAGRAGFSLL